MSLPRPKRWAQFSVMALLAIVTVAAVLTPWTIAAYRAWKERREHQRPIPVMMGPVIPPVIRMDKTRLIKS